MTDIRGPRDGEGTAPAIEYRGITKRFGATVALNDIDLALAPGLVHAFVGENGAGKSTLSKITAGVILLDGGELLLHGESSRFRAPREALDAGVAMVHQEISLVPTLSVFDNVFLGSRRAARTADLRKRFAVLLEDSGFSLDPAARVDTLSLAEQQKVEIVRAMAYDARVMIFDEPTASLTIAESEQLFGAIRRLRERGVTVVYVSHFLDEVLALADTVSIFKDGRLIRSRAASDETVDTLIHGMLGRDLDQVYPSKRLIAERAPVVLSAEGVAGGVVRDVTLDVRSGEIVTIFGLVGSGRSEFARLVFGRDRRSAGVVRLDGEPTRFRSPAAAIRAGIGYLSEDRKDQGLLVLRSVRENLTLATLRHVSPTGFIRPSREKRLARALAEKLELRPLDTERAAGAYSGGNQQKIVFGRWLIRPPRVLIADEPTRGVDVGARRAMYHLLDGLARQGMGVLVISSDIEEVRGLGDRILVMREGRIAASLPGDVEDERILAAAFGEQPKEIDS